MFGKSFLKFFPVTNHTSSRLMSTLLRSTSAIPPSSFCIQSLPAAFENRFLLPQIYYRAFYSTTYRGISKIGSVTDKNNPNNETPQPPNSNNFKKRFGGKTTIIEPPVRTRPFRNFRGPSGSSTLRRPAPTSKRVILNQHYQTTKPLGDYGSYPVTAVHIAQSIDLPKVISKVFAAKGVRKMMERLSVVVQLQPTENHSARFVAVFRFGSVVFFNVGPREVADLLWEIKQHSTAPVLSGSENKEKFCVHVQEGHDLDPEDIVTGDYCVVRELNMKAVDVISSVLSQSVALDSYNDTVDDLLADFERINKAVVGEGNLATVDRHKLFRAVAANNAIFIEMVSKVGIKDRIDTAWNLSQYEDVSQGLIEEFDIEQRFEHIEFKLNLIQQNAKFFLEVLAHQKSNSLEWIIIVLIMFECVLMCMEMSGFGEPFFGYLGSFKPSVGSSG
jgi:uncharacterized Rmd1/YagE family protein